MASRVFVPQPPSPELARCYARFLVALLVPRTGPGYSEAMVPVVDRLQARLLGWSHGDRGEGGSGV